MQCTVCTGVGQNNMNEHPWMATDNTLQLSFVPTVGCMPKQGFEQAVPEHRLWLIKFGKLGDLSDVQRGQIVENALCNIMLETIQKYHESSVTRSSVLKANGGQTLYKLRCITYFPTFNISL